VLTGRAEITNDCIGRCVAARIRIAALSRTGRIRFTVGGTTTGNVLLRIAQHSTAGDPERQLRLAGRFVAGRLANQRRAVQRWANDAPSPETRHHLREQQLIIEERLAAVPSARNGDHLRGLEGDATRRYFKALGAHLDRVASPFPFTDRNRRPPRDPVNALLSFLYGLLTVHTVGSLEAVGLDPQIGFLHQPRPGRPALALDLIEEQRTHAERFAVALLARRRLRPEDFQRGPAGSCHLDDNGRRVVLGAWDEYQGEEITHPLLGQAIPRVLIPSVQATLLARHLRGDLPDYPPYVHPL